MGAPTQSKNFSSLVSLGAAPTDADELLIYDESEAVVTARPKRITFANLKANLAYPGGVDLPVADGGTGGSTAVVARENLLLDAPRNAQTGTTYNVLVTDAFHWITMENSNPNSIVIPANSVISFPLDTELYFMQIGTGTTTISISTDTLNVNAGLLKVLNGQWAMAGAKKLSATQWVLFGNLVPAP